MKRKIRPNPTEIYKSFLLIPHGNKIKVYDISGKVYCEADSIRDAREKIQAYIDAKYKKMPKQNPLTRAETRNLKAESRIHAKIGRTPVQKSFYKGMSAGMMDAAEQYGTNPRKPSAPSNILYVKCLNKRCGFETPYYSDQKFKPHYCIRCGKPIFIPKENPPFKPYKGRVLAYRRDENDPRAMEWLVRMPNEKDWEYAFDTDYRKAISFGPSDQKKIKAEFGAYISFMPIRDNPPLTEIYDRILDVTAVKGPGHACDAACKKAKHTYRHTFTRKHKIYGSPDGKAIIIK